jgi:hypothetical protein
MIEIAKLGRLSSHNAESEARRRETQRKQHEACNRWLMENPDGGMNNETYISTVLPKLRVLTNPSITSALGVSLPYASQLRTGKRLPHPRHRQILAELTFHPTGPPTT